MDNGGFTPEQERNNQTKYAYDMREDRDRCSELYYKSREIIEDLQKLNQILEAENKELREGQEWISVDDKLPDCKPTTGGIKMPWKESDKVVVLVEGSEEYFERGYLIKHDSDDLRWIVEGFNNPHVLKWMQIPHPKPPKEQKQ